MFTQEEQQKGRELADLDTDQAWRRIDPVLQARYQKGLMRREE
ncbi:MAG: hypothetical protein SVV03_06295 [Candidatus Nanohaloarchaea archaeon]|nr:hypothetical protein [Candidatus Nanohaloarchaea archaeon]